MLCSMLRRRAGRTERTKDLLDPLCLPPCREEEKLRECDKNDNDKRSIKTPLPCSFNCCLFFIRVRGGTGVYPSSPWVEGRNIPCTGPQYRTNLVTPINLMCMVLEGGRKLEYLKKPTRVQGEHACRRHKSIPQSAIKSITEALSELTTAVPHCLFGQLLNICYF